MLDFHSIPDTNALAQIDAKVASLLAPFFDAPEQPTDGTEALDVREATVQTAPLGVTLQDGQAELVGCFTVWVLEAEPLQSAEDQPLARLARPTGRRHHQLYINGEPVGYVRSAPREPDGDEWRVVQVAFSDLATCVDETIAWINQTLTEEERDARLLMVPSRRVHALWLYPETDAQEGLVFVADAPPNSETLKKRYRYTEREFVAALRAAPELRGILDDPDPGPGTDPEPTPDPTAGPQPSAKRRRTSVKERDASANAAPPPGGSAKGSAAPKKPSRGKDGRGGR